MFSRLRKPKSLLGNDVVSYNKLIGQFFCFTSVLQFSITGVLKHCNIAEYLEVSCLRKFATTTTSQKKKLFGT